MCGRYITPDEAAFERYWSLNPAQSYRQSFNTTPSQLAPVIRMNEAGDLQLDEFQWGFAPTFWKRKPLHAARSETVFTSGLFAASAGKRRCLAPAIGWYEWQDRKPHKQPYCFHVDGFKPFAFAGIWTARETEDGWVHNFAILTRQADDDLTYIHKRMPVVIGPDDYRAWLSTETEEPASLIHAGEVRISAYPVSTRVNKPENNDAECIVPLQEVER